MGAVEVRFLHNPLWQPIFYKAVVIGGKVANTQRRKYCYNCSPLGSGNNKQIKHEIIAAESAAKKEKNQRSNTESAKKKTRLERKRRLVKMFEGACANAGTRNV